MPRKRVWLAYDIEVGSNYRGLYAWLDDHDAQECGDSLTTFVYDFTMDNLFEQLANDILGKIESYENSRLYIILRDPTTKKMKGKFVLGSRKKNPPWKGYAEKAATPLEDTEE